MSNGKRRDWYDEIYNTYVSSQLLGDDHDILEWTPFGKNSIDIYLMMVSYIVIIIFQIQSPDSIELIMIYKR